MVIFVWLSGKDYKKRIFHCVASTFLRSVILMNVFLLKVKCNCGNDHSIVACNVWELNLNIHAWLYVWHGYYH